MKVTAENDNSADVTITYMTNTGQMSDESFKLPAEGRKTTCVNDTYPNMDLSTWVHADKPIVAERVYALVCWVDSNQVRHDRDC